MVRMSLHSGAGQSPGERQIRALVYRVPDLPRPFRDEAVLAVDALGTRIGVGHPQPRRLLRIQAAPTLHPCRAQLRTRAEIDDAMCESRG